MDDEFTIFFWNYWSPSSGATLSKMARDIWDLRKTRPRAAIANFIYNKIAKMENIKSSVMKKVSLFKQLLFTLLYFEKIGVKLCLLAFYGFVNMLSDNTCRSSHRRCSIKGVSKNFVNFKGKHQQQSLLLNKVTGLGCYLFSLSLNEIMSC